ncbi:phytanoyl-CoA dioxygenase family protein [Salinispirillum marinum]|uniref:Phytanoyl-CoA dioxygenase family protein n=2 Tax=Saccharospirillaceae TaxID=255527 RepID=A0ABV8BDD7_9GAMM
MAMKSAHAASLTPEQIEEFKQNGFVVLPGFAPETLRSTMREVIAQHLQDAVSPLEYEADVGYPGAPSSLDAPGGDTIRRLRGAYRRDAVFRQWATYRPLSAALRQLLEEPVCLSQAHHNCIMTKHPQFGTATDWHRDIRYWSFRKPNLVSVWLALDEERPDNGALKFIPGSHSLHIKPEQLDEMDFLLPDLPENQALFSAGVELTLAPGDVVLFHSGLFHSAGVNRSDQVKTSVVFAYHGHSNQPVPGTRSASTSTIFVA